MCTFVSKIEYRQNVRNAYFGHMMFLSLKFDENSVFNKFNKNSHKFLGV